jgi:SAM-dependent methyltransferase
MPDVDYWATPQPVVERMLELARVKSSDLVYDLGCGDARSLVTAAERYGARGVGFDIDPKVVALARDNVRRHGVEELVRIEQENIFNVDLSPADVVFLFMVPRINWRLVPQFEKMRTGSRIVAHEFAIPGARPIRIVKVPGPPNGPADAGEPEGIVTHTIFLWKMPWQKQRTDWTEEDRASEPGPVR